MTAGFTIRRICGQALFGLLAFTMIAVSPGPAGAEWMGRYSGLMSNPFNWTTVLRPANGDVLEFGRLVQFRIYRPIEEDYIVEFKEPLTFDVTNDYLDSASLVDIHGSYTLSGDMLIVGGGGLHIALGYPEYCDGINRGAVLNLPLYLPDQTIFAISSTCGYAATLNGAINGLGFTKQGNGKLVLAGQAKLLMGDLIVEAGNLCVDVVATSSATSVNGGRLSGRGTVTNVTVADGASVYPGTGGLTANGDVVFASGAIFKVTVATPESSGLDADKLMVSGGSVELGSGTAVLEPEFLATPASGQAYTIIEGADSVEGYFQGLPEGGTGEAGSVQYEITYQGGSGNDVVLTAVGEPVATVTRIYAQYEAYDYGENPLIVLEVETRNGDDRPYGTAQYSLDGLPFESCELSSGGDTLSVCHFALVSPPAGVHTLTGMYPGYGTAGPSQTKNLAAFVVDKADTAVNFTASSATLSLGAYVALHLEVMGYAGDAMPPTGVVTFEDNGNELMDCRQTLHLPTDEDTGEMLGWGEAVCYLAPTEPGVHEITAIYEGDTNYNAVTRYIQGNLTVTAPPTITSADSTVFTAGSAGSFTVTTSAYPVAALAVSGSLPAGVTFADNGDGTATISGTPATAGAKGNYPLEITAANGVSPDGVQTFTLRVEKAEIRVEGNSLVISSGDTTPREADGTDFAAVRIDGDTLSRDFLITNIGNIDLLLTGTPIVEIGGAHFGDFSITTQPAATLLANHSSKFTLQFDPSATGLRTATVSIANNDADEDPYLFAVQGMGICPPQAATDQVVEIGGTSAVLQGRIIDLGYPVRADQYGCVWNTVGAPTTSDSRTEMGSTDTTGSFTCEMTGLVAGETYYVRSYATNDAGTSYGAQVVFTTLAPPTTALPTAAIYLLLSEEATPSN